MSRNHENVIWQSKDKTWSLGLFKAEGRDDYDYDKFEFASVGHASEESANRSYPGPNTGGGTVISYRKENVPDIAEYDRMAQFYLHPELAEAAAKKEIAKKKREHAKKLKEAFAENKDYKGRDVTVVIKLDDQPYTRLGISQSYTGYMHTEGDWLVVEGAKVKNLKTGRLNPKLHEVTIARLPSSYGRMY